MSAFKKACEFYEELGRVWHTPRRWAIIREYYEIRGHHFMNDGFDPYELGLERFWTPIEFQVWQDIRTLGLPFAMQFPVGRRFVDFGAPSKRVAIEADGAWHNEKYDTRRDIELDALGWTVYHIPGRLTYGDTGTELIRQIAKTHWGIA